MPRVGGIYSEPAGTKGVSNNTIQSVPYNAFIDDLVNDLNAPRPVTAGGTGATNATTARTNLGLAIGTNVQAYDAGLQSIAGLTTTADRMIYTTAADVYATTALTPFARTILDDASAAAVKTTLGLAAVASSGSAADLTTGTLPNARLVGDYSFANLTLSGGIVSGGSAEVNFGYTISRDSQRRAYLGVAGGPSYSLYLARTNSSGESVSQIALQNDTATGFVHNGQTVWTAGNDGAGSGLDADVLDGQQGSYYRDLANSTGTLPNARISGAYDGITTLGMSGLLTINTAGEAIRLNSTSETGDPYITWYRPSGRQGFIQHTDGTGTNGFRINNDVAGTQLVLLNGGGSSGLYFNDGTSGRTVYHTGNLSLSTLSGTPDTRQIVAGNGLTGGGTLEANRTLTLGTPSPITNSSGDTVTSTSHSHSLGFIAAEVSTTTSANTTSFPLGHLLVVLVPSGMNRNASVVPCLHSSNAQYYVSQDHGSAGTVIPGTWRSRGRTDSEEGIYTLQRVG
ncbi:MAG: hypothetical protein QHC90_25230 [Shinella sp.]|nr:hypothetical protein [Shinella sp.]